ncbi:MAG: ABC transporter permease [Bryobacteraceae bacterium]
MSARYVNIALEPSGHSLDLSFDLENVGSSPWRAEGDLCVGWQLIDAETRVFLDEGDWQRAEHPIAPGASHRFRVRIQLPEENGRYHAYVSPRNEEFGWFYATRWPFLLVEATVRAGTIENPGAEVVTTSHLSLRALPKNLRIAFLEPWRTIRNHHRLISSLVRREIVTRYRGSLGDVAWTVIHPLLLMLTYFFVFGIVLQARFGQDPSRAGFVLYFLAGMLPWLPASEAIARSATVILENRNFVKKLVFPVETLPLNLSVTGLVTEAFALLIFLALLLVTRGAIPPTLAWLPVLLVPQWLLTAGICWLLAALGVFFRDLGQILGFALTLWFFLTPICYPEASLPSGAAALLQWNPMFVLVRAYRAILLEASAPALGPLVALWAAAIGIFLTGHAAFWKLRRLFADVI